MASNNIESRYFTNPYKDYDPSIEKEVVLNVEFWKSFVAETFFECMMKLKPKNSNKYCDGGIYTGNLGCIFTAYKVLKSGLFADNQSFTEQTKKYVRECLKANEEFYETSQLKSSRDASFLVGKAGFYFMGAIAKKIQENSQGCLNYAREYAKLAPLLEPVQFLPNGSDELFVGRAGYLAGCLFLKKYLNIDVLEKSQIFKLCNSMIQSGRWYATKYGSPCPLMYAYHGTEYLGAAHGLGGIIQILLSFPDYLNQNQSAENDVKRTVDYLLSIQKSNGNFASSMDENHLMPKTSSKELVHWCHGAGGLIYMFAKAYLYWKEKKYLNACILAGSCIWEKGLLKKGPGICHGVAGGGYAHLLLYRLTNDKKYLYRAKKFAQFLHTDKFKQEKTVHLEARTPDSPFSLFEGLSGTVSFAIDLLQPDSAEYPLLPIF